jgi:osmotically-inducible protein OsmY
VSPVVAGNNGNVNDAGITRSIETEMKGYDGISSHLVDVETENGVVRLSGFVDNLLARDQSVTLAKSIKGVRSVIDELEVRPVARTDTQIHHDILEALETDPATESWKIDVSVEDGNVTLSGSSGSWQENRLAEQIAKGVRGVRSVDNEMVYIPLVKRPDAEIKHDVEQTLEMDIRLNDARTKVSVKKGEVTLSGYVASSAEKTLAEELARVPGVSGVNSEKLAVSHAKVAQAAKLRTDMPSYSDEEITAALQAAFKLDPRVKTFDLETMVSDGTATLMGKVDNYAAKLAAERDARNTVGVQHVVNLLKVRPAELLEDAALYGRIISALRRDPQLEVTDIDVTVRNGRVILTGEPDNTFEVGEAYRVVSGVDGVAEVDNRLKPTTVSIPPYGLHCAWNHYVPDGYWPFEEIPKSLDSEIKSDVESELFWSPFLDSDQIEVKVNDGTVTLSGYVDDYAERRIATENAWEGGAHGVLNHLEVR